MPPVPPEETDFYSYFLILKKRKLSIFIITFLGLLLGLYVAVFSPNIYRSTAIIIPTGNGKGSNLGPLSALRGLAGLNMPGSAGTSEIITLLQTRQLREVLIKEYELLPVLFFERWDEEKKSWKKGEEGFLLDNVLKFPRQFLSYLVQRARSLPAEAGKDKKKNDGPSVNDGIRALNSIYSITEDKRVGTIKISADFHDPAKAAWLSKILLQTLKDYMSSEAIVTAEKNLANLHQELPSTTDPLLRQKLQTLIAQNLERKVMAKVNREFAFKILDPPYVPDRKFKPKRSQIVMVRLVGSLIFGIFLAFFREYLQSVREQH
nr:Wzz/FepE/Etk N-terminal domain-containing protein [Desulfovulcanus ferrireducens]